MCTDTNSETLCKAAILKKVNGHVKSIYSMILIENKRGDTMTGNVIMNQERL